MNKPNLNTYTVLAQDTDGAFSKRTIKAEDVVISNGHLMFYNHPFLIAAYHPNTWMRFEKNETT